MVSELLHNDRADPFWALWEISLGSMACMCCVVFLGLKLKWFRAQLRLGDSPNSNVAAAPVQGVGFKLKSNPDDFQLYKVTSEFAPVTHQNKQKPIQQQNAAQNKNPNYTTNMNPVVIKPAPTSDLNKSTTMTQVPFKPVSKPPNSNTSSNTMHNKTNIQNKQPNTNTISDATDNKIIFPQTQPPIQKDSQTTKPEAKPNPILKKENLVESTDVQNKNSTVNFEDDHIEILNPSAQKYSDLINKPLKQNAPTKIIDDGYEQPITKKVNEHVNKPSTNISNVAKQPQMQIKNPLATRNMTMPMENEDDWKIKIVDEKPKVQPKQEKKSEGGNMDDLYFTATNSNMYSSQAASIFFGGKTPVAQPRPRKFVEMEEDNISTGSQTSA